MWINEYNEEETMQMFKEEGRREGRQEGRQEGRREGRREGRQEGENLFAALISKLISLGRNEDISKVASDAAFRDSLYIQYGLKKSL